MNAADAIRSGMRLALRVTTGPSRDRIRRLIARTYVGTKKTCVTCGIPKHRGAFGKRHDASDGRMADCRMCRREYLAMARDTDHGRAKATAYTRLRRARMSRDQREAAGLARRTRERKQRASMSPHQTRQVKRDRRVDSLDRRYSRQFGWPRVTERWPRKVLKLRCKPADRRQLKEAFQFMFDRSNDD